jgi:hypothetical protein
MIADDNMGSDDNITNKTFSEIAKKKNKSVDEVKHDVLHMLDEGKITDSDVEQMFVVASKVWGQSIEEAKKNTKDLLQDVLKHKAH